MENDILLPLNRAGNDAQIGNKAAGLRRLKALGMTIPRTFVLPGAVFRRFQRGDPALRAALLGEIERKLRPDLAYAVRSSANLEDGLDHSFAGQFQTVLNARGSGAVAGAVWSIWETTTNPQVQAYMQRHGIPGDGLVMAVIVQEMVTPVASGVAFSRNPITGAHEVVIEAVEGEGSALVQAGVTPLRWTFRGGAPTTQPEASPVPAEVVAQIAAGTARLARRAKTALDLEWVYDGQAVTWLQMRPITSLGSLAVYSNRMSREMMGGMIKPLIWSVNVPVVNGAWIRLLAEVTGPNALVPEKLARTFHYRPYFNMGLLGEVFQSLGIPAESLEMSAGIAPAGSGKFRFRPGPRLLRVLPRAARFLWRAGRLDGSLPAKLAEIEAGYRAFDLAEIPRLDAPALVGRIERLMALTAEAAYFNIQVPILMQVYNGMLRGRLKKLGIDPAALDMGQDAPDFHPYTPAYHMGTLFRAYQALDPEAQALVCSAGYDAVMAHERLDGFREDLAGLVARFGHLSDQGNDFSSVPWRENCDHVLKMVTGYAERKAGAVKRVRFEDLPLPAAQRLMLSGLYRKARRFLLFREQISYIYTYGYGLFRPYFLALGAWMRAQGWLDAPEDIFYLEWPAARQAAVEGRPPADLRACAAAHRAAMEAARDVLLPTVIYGDQPPPPEPVSARKLAGVATSPGYCTGRLTVVSGIQDFHKVQEGDILVIPFSDVGWTPLFSRAAAVIAESGGMLSHSSIIAREYGIPAVVSVPHATRLPDGAQVSVDGYKGEIFVHEEVEDPHARTERQ